MTGFFNDLREECDEILGWTMHGVQDVASYFSNADTDALAMASSEQMSGAFLSALRSRDVSGACALGRISGNWPALAMGAIAQLEEAWNDDTLAIGEIAETYWTLRRTLDELISTPLQMAKPSLFIGKAVIWIPKTEQHTFGPQMLVDRIERIGWDAQLWHDQTSDEVMEQLASHDTDVLGISVGTDNRLDGLADLIARVRQCAMNAGLKVLVGGSAICGASNQYRFLGADRVATSAEDAMQFFGREWTEIECREGRFDG